MYCPDLSPCPDGIVPFGDDLPTLCIGWLEIIHILKEMFRRHLSNGCGSFAVIQCSRHLAITNAHSVRDYLLALKCSAAKRIAGSVQQRSEFSAKAEYTLRPI